MNSTFSLLWKRHRVKLEEGQPPRGRNPVTGWGIHKNILRNQECTIACTQYLPALDDEPSDFMGWGPAGSVTSTFLSALDYGHV